MTNEDKHEITRLSIRAALLLLQNGAESALVVQVASRLGKALGASQIECTLTANSVVLTAIFDNHCITTARHCAESRINMSVVTAVQWIMHTAEAGHFDLQQVHAALETPIAPPYPRWLVITTVALSCACFARLSHGDWLTCAITFLASWLGMLVRTELVARHFNPLIVFSVTAFVASCISGIAMKYAIVADSHIAMAAAVLMLVPGFPLVNSLSDVLKGYMNMGIGRWTQATVLTLATCLGIIFALTVLNIDKWSALL